jgi:hypothetical protein
MFDQRDFSGSAVNSGKITHAFTHHQLYAVSAASIHPLKGACRKRLADPVGLKIPGHELFEL